jgi:hypothetical protein
MNEELIQKLIKLKIAEAELLAELLPPAATKMFKSLGRLVCEEVGAHFYGQNKDVSNETSSDGVRHVSID